jgi:hypothetical protein
VVREAPETGERAASEVRRWTGALNPNDLRRYNQSTMNGLPSDWIEFEGLRGSAETSQLDFKEALPVNPKLARCLAAMSVAGGVVVLGMAQNRQTGLAAEPVPIAAVAKAEERIGQVIAGSIKPALKAPIKVIHDPANPAQGAIVVRVPRSEIGPHEVEGRFPTRSGTTTRDLSPAEVAAIYREREQALPRPAELLDDATLLPAMPDVRVRSVFAGFGQLRLAARPRDGDTEHPDSPWLADSLASAARRARLRAEERLAIYAPTRLLPALQTWRPNGSSGWVAGRAGQSPEELAQRPSAAAVLTWPWRTLVQMTVPTLVPAGRDAPPYLCANEGFVATEAWGALAFFGELYGAGGPRRLDLAIQLAGFEGAVSYYASHAMEGLPVGHLPQADHGLTKLVTLDSQDLVEDPEGVARGLIERWLVPFYEGGDLLDYVTVPRQSGVRLR